LTGKTRHRNDIFCVDGDVKPYSLTHSCCCGCQGYRKHLRELFVRAGYQTSAEQWKLQAEAVANTADKKTRESAEFETLYECRSVSFFLFPRYLFVYFEYFILASLGSCIVTEEVAFKFFTQRYLADKQWRRNRGFRRFNEPGPPSSWGPRVVGHRKISGKKIIGLLRKN